MEDHHDHHHLFFGVYESPSVDGLFSAHKPIALTNSPPAVDADRNHFPAADVDSNAEDYNALWLSLCDDISPIAALVDHGGDHTHPGGFEAGPSGTFDDRDRQETGEDHGKCCAPENIGTPLPGNNDDDLNLMRPLQILPAPTVPFNCSFCQVLREIIHVHNDYNNYMKLEIHGRIGVISHAILERKIANAVNCTSDNDNQSEMLDFSSKSTAEVKQLLTSYCLQRSEEGYVMSNDPLSIFYEALSVGLSPQSIFHNMDIVPGGDSGYQNSEQQQPEHQPHQQREVEQAKEPATNKRRAKRTSRISLAAQRKRTARLTLMDLREVFHLALVEAAKRMQVCSTVLKKICRRDGIERWPYRKLDSVKKKIAELQQNLNSSDAETRAEAEEKIDALRREAMDACGGINIL